MQPALEREEGLCGLNSSKTTTLAQAVYDDIALWLYRLSKLKFAFFKEKSQLFCG